MKQPAPPSAGDNEQDWKSLSSSEEARRVIEEYAKDLVEIIKRLRGLLH